MRNNGEGRQGKGGGQPSREGRHHQDRGGQNRQPADATFDAAAWVPGKREYGLLHLLLCRAAMAEELAKPKPPGRLKSMEARLCHQAQWQPPAQAASNKKASPAEEEDEDYISDASSISEGEPAEPNDAISWGRGHRGAWWRVRTSIREDLVVRGGLSLQSAEIRRTSPGDVLLQKGGARLLTGSRAQGCIRMPVEPNGWVTADATRAGGPTYLVRAQAPRWRAIWRSQTGEADVIVRSTAALDSEPVACLSCGDVVQQAGPSETRPGGIVRMPILLLGRKAEGAKTGGWVTADASRAGGPVFFKLLPDADGQGAGPAEGDERSGRGAPRSHGH